MDFRNLIVYQKAIAFLATTYPVLSKLPTGSGELASQYRRASTSVVLNIAEGAGKYSPADKRRFYLIARGSAFECAAILDVLKTCELMPEFNYQEAYDLLTEVSAILTKLSVSQKSSGKVQVQAQAQGN